MFRRISVGSELDSYCGKCKMTLNHMVTAMVEDTPRRVRCLTCNSEHNHRVTKAKSTKTGAKKTRASTKKTSKVSAGAQWQGLVASWDDAAAKPYSIFSTFNVNDYVTHSTFGRGVVTDIPSPDRMITLFESGEKMLMQGKKRG